MITYLDRFIMRMVSQRAALQWALAAIADLHGPIVEFGLGSGRSYDFLRQHAAPRAVYVLDRAVSAHPACMPEASRLILGEFADTAPEIARRFAGQAAMVHADVGSNDAAASRALAASLAPHWRAILAEGGLLISDQKVADDGFETLRPDGLDPERYHIYRRHT